MKRFALAIVFALSLLCATLAWAFAVAPKEAANATDAGTATPEDSGASGRNDPVGTADRPRVFLGNQSLPPMNSLKDGKPTGIVIDLVAALAARMPYPVEIRLMDWNEAQRLVLAGKADALLQINPNPDRLEIYDFSTPLLTSEFTIFTSAERQGIASLRDLRGLKVGVEKSGLPILLLQKDPQILVEVIPDFLQGFGMLTTGAIDAVIADQWVGSYILAENDIRHVKMIEEPISRSHSALAVKKGNGRLLADINAALAEIRQDGTYDRILGQWQSKEVVFKTREQLRKQTWLWLIAAISLALLVALAGILAQAREIRRRRRSEEALCNSQAMLNMVFDTVPQSIFWKDREGRYLGCNRVFAAAAGLDDHEQILGMTDFDLPWPRQEAEAYRADDQAVLEQNQPKRHIIEPLQQADGTRLYVETTKIPLLNESGQPFAVLGIYEDITYRKLAEEALRESELRYRSLFEDALEGIFQTSLDGAIMAVNPALARHYGYDSPEQFITELQHTQSLYVDLRDRERWLALLLENGRVENFELQLRRRDGSAVWSSSSAHLVRDAQGRPLYIRGSVLDITERKQAEEALRNYRDHLEELVAQRTQALEREITERELAQEALRQAKESAEAANLAKSVFLANMSHELRTPLNSVLGFSQILRSDSALSESQRENLDIILRSGAHLLGLINDVLEISKIETGLSKPVNTSFDLWTLLDTVAEMMRVRIDEKGLRFTLERDPDLPRRICADKRKLKQVMLNLVGNAVKFTVAGYVALRARADKDRDVLRFEVEDSGPGIAATDIPKLFERFGQGESGVEGVGLGLYISKKLVGIMGGQITVATGLGHGSLFAFDIPYAPADFVEPTPPIVSARMVRLAPGQPAVRVLVAEDKDENRLLLVSMLHAAGFEVAEAKNGEEAVRSFETSPPDLVLMDLRMPVLDGHEAIRRIKASEKGKKTPLFAVTASAFEEDRQKVLASGADEFIRKPICADLLFRMIRKWLHVEYLHTEAPRGEPEVLRKEDAKTLVAGLPQALTGKLEKALTSLELRTFKALLEEVSGYDGRLADGLRRLANGYEINTLLEIFDRGLHA